ncbi:hypothetical protein COHA_004727 [Chlorella ohadii]|uniref:Helicase C-terminal domain-containing protein n=1 Tax=Chlorella ohadii TaxID=2649997 RepID=A0AAD5DR37_9CHLO|nr:hypothetical protein COHA_004727 [Chlorella ohadii]
MLPCATAGAQVVVASVQTAKNKKNLARLVEQGFEVRSLAECSSPTSCSCAHMPCQKNEHSFGFETDDEGTLINTSSDPEDSTQNGSTEGDSEDMEKEEEEDSCLDWEEASMQLGSGARLLVGFTATPFRPNNKDLGMVFQEVTFQPDILYLVGRGFLAPPAGYRILTEADLSEVKSTKTGDFRESELEVYVNTPHRNALTARAYQELAPGRPAIVFCVGAQVLTNCMILTEGFDQASVSCVIMARPTKSTGLYIQCIGRGLRLHDGKSECIVLDLTDRHHDINAPVSLGSIWEELPSGLERDKAQSVNLTAVKSGDLALLKPRYGWLPYGDSGHFVLDVFRPNETWYVWLLACRRLGPTAQPGGEEPGSAAAGAGSNGDGNGSESSGDEPMYVVQLLRRKWGGYTWHGSRRKRGQSKTSSPLTMKAALRWAEAQVQDEFSDHKRVSWGRAPTFIQRNRLRSQLGWDQADIVLDRQQLDSGQAATLIGLHQLTADFKAGKFSFPELFC